MSPEKKKGVPPSRAGLRPGWRVRLPEDIRLMFADADGLERLSEVYAGRVFGFKKAMKCSKEASRLRSNAWKNIRDIHPEAPPNMRYTQDWVMEYFPSDSETPKGSAQALRRSRPKSSKRKATP